MRLADLNYSSAWQGENLTKSIHDLQAGCKPGFHWDNKVKTWEIERERWWNKVQHILELPSFWMRANMKE